MNTFRPLVAAILVLIATSALAQAPATELAPGTGIRLFVVDTVPGSGEPHYSFPTGTIVGFDDGFVVLRPGSGVAPAADSTHPVRVPVMNVNSAEAFVGMQRHPIVGAVLGSAVGAVTGYVFGHNASNQACYSFEGAIACNSSPYAAQGSTNASRAALGAGVGALAGAVVGYFVRTERWTTIDLPTLRSRSRGQ